MSFLRPDRRPAEEEAMQVDLYLESLLAAHAPGPRPLVEEPAFDPGERSAAQLLASRLVRFHPSFRFEEALAARLRAVATGGNTAERATVTAFPSVSAPPRPAFRDRRSVLIGGAIASGVSLAGVALFAWRVAAPPRTPFGRAARAAHRGRAGAPKVRN
jgi:hypothetical protein